MPQDNEHCILLDSKFFAVRAIQPLTIESNDLNICKQITQAQHYNQQVSQALETILKNGHKTILKGLEDWNYENGLILYKGHIYIPDNLELQKDIVKMYHDSMATGHPGRWKTYELISDNYWWPRISQFVQKYMDSCATCQAMKIKPKTHIPLQPIAPAPGIWKSITMDFVTNLPVSQGFDSMFVVVDRFSKVIIAAPCNKTISAEQTTSLYLEQVWR